MPKSPNVTLPTICPECGGPGLVTGSMPDEYKEPIYTCPTNNCGDWYTASPRREADRKRAAHNQSAAARRVAQRKS